MHSVKGRFDDIDDILFTPYKEKSLHLASRAYFYKYRRAYFKGEITDNPTNVSNPVWTYQVLTGLSGYDYNSLYLDDIDNYCICDPNFSFERFGRSMDELMDGSTILIGGNHEDYYDPDFHVYNDVTIVTETDGVKDVTIYMYHWDVLPPLEYHQTIVDEEKGYIDIKCENESIYRLFLEDYHVECIKDPPKTEGHVTYYWGPVVDPQVLKDQQVLIEFDRKMFDSLFRSKEQREFERIKSQKRKKKCRTYTPPHSSSRIHKKHDVIDILKDLETTLNDFE